MHTVFFFCRPRPQGSRSHFFAYSLVSFDFNIISLGNDAPRLHTITVISSSAAAKYISRMRIGFILLGETERHLRGSSSFKRSFLDQFNLCVQVQIRARCIGNFFSFLRYDYDLIKRIICVAAYVVCCKYEHFVIVISVRVSPYRCSLDSSFCLSAAAY